jgi:hypothetical protein
MMTPEKAEAMVREFERDTAEIRELLKVKEHFSARDATILLFRAAVAANRAKA